MECCALVHSSKWLSTKIAIDIQNVANGRYHRPYLIGCLWIDYDIVDKLINLTLMSGVKRFCLFCESGWQIYLVLGICLLACCYSVVFWLQFFALQR